MSIDSAIEQELAQRELHQRLEREQNRDDLKFLLSTPQGQRVLTRVVFEFGGLQQIAYSPDARQHALNEGQRTVGAAMEREIFMADRDGWARMHAERIEKIRSIPIDEKPNKSDQ